MRASQSKQYVLISGFEIGGQMDLLARGLRERWIPATSVAFNDDFRGYQNDVKIADNGIFGFFVRFAFFVFALFRYNVFHFFWGVSLLSFWRFRFIDLPFLKLFGKKIIVHFRGLDIVDIGYFDYKRAISRGENLEKPPLSNSAQIRAIKIWEKFADEILVSEPDLLFVSKRAIISPQVIDVDYWATDRLPKSSIDGKFRIAHAPSSRRKKGTDFIEVAINELVSEGYNIELVLAEDLPFDKIKDLYIDADIGIDQVLYGWHGKVSVELMSLGRPVICNIDEDLRRHRPELPIVHGDPNNLKEVIVYFYNNPLVVKKLSLLSIEYAKKFHSKDVVLDDLTVYYGFSESTNYKNAITDAKKW
jgi:hypothetical protein